MVTKALIFRDGRRDQRRITDAPSTIRRSDGAPTEGFVDNLSTTGFHVTTDERLSLGEGFSIGIAGAGRYRARVVRATDRGFGCEFLAPIPLSAIHRAGKIEAVGLLTKYSSDVVDFEDHRETKYPGAVRLFAIIGASAALWYGIFKLLDIRW